MFAYYAGLLIRINNALYDINEIGSIADRIGAMHPVRRIARKVNSVRIVNKKRRGKIEDDLMPNMLRIFN